MMNGTRIAESDSRRVLLPSLSIGFGRNPAVRIGIPQRCKTRRRGIHCIAKGWIRVVIGAPAIRRQMQQSRWTPWLGLVAPPVAWAVHHQVASNLMLYDCRLGGTGLVTLIGVTMAAIAAFSGLISWSSRREDSAELRTLAGYIGAMSGAVFFLALAFQTTATLMLPDCQG